MTGQKEHLEAVARGLAIDMGLINLTLKTVCEAAEIPQGSFKHITGEKFTEFVDRLGAEELQGPIVFVTRKRANPILRRNSILNAALGLAAAEGYRNITREDVANAAGVSAGMVSRLFGTMTSFRRALMRFAIQSECLPVIAQGVALNDNQISGITNDLRDQAINSLKSGGPC